MTPREPDRFDKQALELYRYCKREMGTDQPASYDCPHPSVDDIAAALRAAAFSPLGDNHHNAAACPHCGDLLSEEKVKAESSALERAAQEVRRIEAEARDEEAVVNLCDELERRIRALIPPAAAPAACPTPYRCRAGHHDLCPAAAPAAETGKAQGADKIGYCKTCGLDASHGVCNDPRDALLRECEEALIGVKYMVTEKAWVVVNDLLVRLAARAAPPEGEGT